MPSQDWVGIEQGSEGTPVVELLPVLLVVALPPAPLLLVPVLVPVFVLVLVLPEPPGLPVLLLPLSPLAPSEPPPHAIKTAPIPHPIK